LSFSDKQILCVSVFRILTSWFSAPESLLELYSFAADKSVFISSATINAITTGYIAALPIYI